MKRSSATLNGGRRRTTRKEPPRRCMNIWNGYNTTGTPGTLLQTIPYIYGDSNWRDKLTAYNGNAIAYDAIGNPLTDGQWAYT